MNTTLVTPELTALDRCDRCGAQAYVRVTLAAGGELLFCGHHWSRHEGVLRPKATEVVDQTHRLSESEAPIA